MKTLEYLTIELEGYKPFKVELTIDNKIDNKYTCRFLKFDPDKTTDQQPCFIDFFKTNGFTYWRQQDGTICFKPNTKGNEMFYRYIWLIWHQIHINSIALNPSIGGIPQNISKEHILSAMAKIDKGGVPAIRTARKYEIVKDGKEYPPKLLIEYVNKFANGDTPIGNFSSHQASGYLVQLGFTVVSK
jgi:hypothetical protein